jgi:hypothetical protein
MSTIDICISCGNKREVNPNSMSANFCLCFDCQVKKFKGVGA